MIDSMPRKSFLARKKRLSSSVTQCPQLNYFRYESGTVDASRLKGLTLTEASRFVEKRKVVCIAPLQLLELSFGTAQ